MCAVLTEIYYCPIGSIPIAKMAVRGHERSFVMTLLAHIRFPIGCNVSDIQRLICGKSLFFTHTQIRAESTDEADRSRTCQWIKHKTQQQVLSIAQSAACR